MSALYRISSANEDWDLTDLSAVDSETAASNKAAELSKSAAKIVLDDTDPQVIWQKRRLMSHVGSCTPICFFSHCNNDDASKIDVMSNCNNFTQPSQEGALEPRSSKVPVRDSNKDIAAEATLYAEAVVMRPTKNFLKLKTVEDKISLLSDLSTSLRQRFVGSRWESAVGTYVDIIVAPTTHLDTLKVLARSSFVPLLTIGYDPESNAEATLFRLWSDDGPLVVTIGGVQKSGTAAETCFEVCPSSQTVTKL